LEKSNGDISRLIVRFTRVTIASAKLSCLKFVVCIKETCNPLTLWQIDFFIKLFRTSDISVVAYCQGMFQFDLPSVILKKRLGKFDTAVYRVVTLKV